MGFLPFTPRASPTVFGLLWASFQDYPLTHWLPLLLLSTCLLQRYSFHDKIPFCLFLLYTSTSRWLNKDWATSWPSSMACIRWSLLLVLFRSATCCLISSRVSCYIYHFPLVWLFFPSHDSYCWHFLPFLVSFCCASSYQFSRLSFYTKEFGPLWAR